MADRLKIYACSGIGSNDSYEYWRDNVNVLRNTQAVNNLMVSIDSNLSDINLGVNNNRAIELLNEIDLYTVSLLCAQDYSGDIEKLDQCGKILCTMVMRGDFNFNSLNSEERDEHLDQLFATLSESLNNGSYEYQDKSFKDWWESNVIALDKVGMSESDCVLFEECLFNALPKKMRKVIKRNSSIATDDPNIGKYLRKSGNYFLYTYFTNQQLARLPYVFTKKHHQQKRIYEYVKSFYVGVYGTEEAMKKEIRNGIVNEFKKQPEAVCAYIASKSKGVGDFGITEIISLIAAIAPIIVAIISGVFDYVKSKSVAEQQSLDKQIIEDNTMDEKDYSVENFNFGGIDNKLIFIGAGLLGLFLIFKK